MTDKLDIIIDKLNRIEANTADAKPDFSELGKAIGEAIALLTVAITAQEQRTADVEKRKARFLAETEAWIASRKLRLDGK